MQVRDDPIRDDAAPADRLDIVDQLALNGDAQDAAELLGDCLGQLPAEGGDRLDGKPFRIRQRVPQ